jgi:hypothetical protein
MEVPLDIVARLHAATTIVRCAAASSTSAAASSTHPSATCSRPLRATAIGGPPPDRIVAASYEIVDHNDNSCGDDDDVIETTGRLRLDNSLLQSHSFKSARFELLVLWWWLPPKRPSFFNKGLQNPASTSMDVHNQLIQTNVG